MIMTHKPIRNAPKREKRADGNGKNISWVRAESPGHCYKRLPVNITQSHMLGEMQKIMYLEPMTMILYEQSDIGSHLY